MHANLIHHISDIFSRFLGNPADDVLADANARLSGILGLPPHAPWRNICDALHRAADEMEAQSVRIDRLIADVRDRADKIHEVRLELRRAGFPVNEGAWPTEQLRALIADRAALLAAGDPMIAELIAILGGACLPSEIVGRVRSAVADNADLSRRLEAVTLDRDSLVGKLDAMRTERDDLRKTVARCQTACGSAGIAIRSDVSERVYHMAAELSSLRQERDALRAHKPVEWRGRDLFVAGKLAGRVRGSVWRTDVWAAFVPGQPMGMSANETSARSLLLLLSGHDPGGVWRVNGDIVSPDTVRLVCPSVAVTWGES